MPFGLTMTDTIKNEQTGLTALRNFLTEQEIAVNGRLPAERELCNKLGLSRGNLRKALAVLEAEGLLWRHVGRGTYIGARPVLNLSDVEFLSSQTSPTAVMEARMAVEPQIARMASMHGTEANFSEMRRCNRRCKAARGWRVYEAWDNNFHQVIATATHNKLLISLFDTMNAVRRAVVWGQLRQTKFPPKSHESFHEHDAIYEAIVSRNADQAAECMRAHLKTVHDRILSSMDL